MRKAKNKQNVNVSISVIIPCYNTEDYIEPCIDSVLKQSMTNFEVIAVNDGSTDSTLNILKKYEQEDSRIKVIDLPHNGYGHAVNSALEKSEGDYISIVESDDLIAPEMLETLYKKAIEENCDIVKANFYDYYEKEGTVPEVFVNQERAAMPEISKPFSLKQVPQILDGHPSIWSAIYKKDFLKENRITFKEVKGAGWVDNPFFFETLCKAKKIFWVKEPLYYYRKTNPTASSKKIENPVMPFERMMDNLDVLAKNNCTDEEIIRRAYGRALVYLRGALDECDYANNYDLINEYAKKLMQRLDSSIMLSDFNLHDQYTWMEYASPLKTLQEKQPKILLYNWLPFDNQWGWGGGVTVYCKNVIDIFLREYPNAQIYFLSSGFAYMATTTEISYRKIPNVFGDRVQQFEIVNSPVPADQRNIYNNPLIALENKDLKQVVKEFIEQFGEFTAIHFNNIEGLSLDVFDLKEEFPNTRFIFSIHNYVPMCVTGSYYMRHKHCNCTPEHTGEDCFACVHTDIESKFAIKTYERGLFGQDKKDCLSQNFWAKTLGFDRLDQTVFGDEILKFAQTATAQINKNCDKILAVSKRVYDIAAAEGFDESKMIVSYIGTLVAKRQIGHSSAEVKDGLKVVFLGNDINYEEKGYPWLLETLEKLDEKYASQIDLLLTTRNAEHAEIYDKCKKFRSVKVVQGYTHRDLGNLLSDCNLGLVPVLWEDNLPQIAIEMAAYGVPVLASSAGGASELCSSELFKFESGNSEEFLSKLIHFLENPEDLNQYWEHHPGLVTMEHHLEELIQIYGLPLKPEAVKVESKDYAYLLMENEFLKKNISLNENKFTPNPILEKLSEELKNEKEKNITLKKELKKMQDTKGKIIFQTEYNPIQGHVGADMFQFTLKDFDWSDFYAEIKFVHLENVNASYSDVLRISGTLRSKDGKKNIILHQIEWSNGVAQLSDYIYYYLRDNSIIFFARYPGLCCGFDWEIQTLTSRAEGNTVEYTAINNGFIHKNQVRPKDAFNKL
ncbi:hypothetical protein B5F07_02585 [Lachnoclostridium sp. An169]|uniref:glycosyltransferase n=1 Tax=Lachnoclostridium sp. An169 TaxID=1965569 RepID=UPI000B370203|nr:glycosyltransferase [Lachnoclostridium sp. An169]OUP86197.1 hypothetical protein B5F07_02585 [Lachnoclostridium sp. An169]